MVMHFCTVSPMYASPHCIILGIIIITIIIPTISYQTLSQLHHIFIIATYQCILDIAAPCLSMFISLSLSYLHPHLYLYHYLSISLYSSLDISMPRPLYILISLSRGCIRLHVSASYRIPSHGTVLYSITALFFSIVLY